jgi:hypothetical protein
MLLEGSVVRAHDNEVSTSYSRERQLQAVANQAACSSALSLPHSNMKAYAGAIAVVVIAIQVLGGRYACLELPEWSGRLCAGAACCL